MTKIVVMNKLVSNMSKQLSKEEKIAFIEERGWRECCLYDDLYNPPFSLDRDLIRSEDDRQVVWSIDDAYEIALKLG